MDEIASERERRRAEIVTQVRERQRTSGHQSPVPAFLNAITDMIIDIELRLNKLEVRQDERDRS